MVKEKRIVFEVKDLRRIGLRCEKCNAEVGTSLSKFNEVPCRCPVCRHDWRLATQEYHIIDMMVEMLDRCSREPTDESVGFFLELDGDDPAEK